MIPIKQVRATARTRRAVATRLVGVQYTSVWGEQASWYSYPMPVDTRLTYDDFCLLPEDGKRREIIEGELFVTPSPHWMGLLPFSPPMR